MSFCLFLYIIYLRERERQPVELEILHTRTLPNRIREKRKPSTEWLRSAELFHFFSARLDLPEIYISILLSLSLSFYIYIYDMGKGETAACPAPNSQLIDQALVDAASRA